MPLDNGATPPTPARRPQGARGGREVGRYHRGVLAALGGLLRDTRARWGLSRAAVAARVDGLTIEALRRYETGRRVPDAATLLVVLDVLGACPRGLVPRPGDIVISTQALLADPDTPPNLAAWARLRAHSGHIVVHLRHSLGVWAALDVLAGPDYRAAVTTDTGSVIEPDQVRPRHRPRR